MRGSRLSVGVVASLAITLLLASIAYAGPVKKVYNASVTPANPPVTAGQPETFDMIVSNKATTQQLGSCNVTLPTTFTGIAATHPVITGTSTQSGTAEVAGNVIQLRNMATPPMGSRSFTFTATAPVGVHTLGIECRQANNYAPSTPSNKFTYQGPALTITAVSPLPNADLDVVTDSETPDPVFGGNVVKYILTVKNQGPAATGATVRVTDTVSGAGNFSSIGGPGWSCSTTGSTRTCDTGQLASGASISLDVRVLANVVSSATSVTNAASVSDFSGQTNDPDPGDNNTSETTTVNPGGSSGSGYIDNQTGGTVITEPSATAINRFVAAITFPGQEGAAPGGFVYSMHQDTDTCALLPCNFAMFIDAIGAQYDNPSTEGVRLVLRCDATVCPGSSTGMQMFVRDETGNQKLVFNCNIAGIVDPSPCVESVIRLSGGANQGDLQVTMLFLAGDPKVAGIQIG